MPAERVSRPQVTPHAVRHALSSLCTRALTRRNLRRVAMIALGAAIIGGMLLINHWFGIPSSAATFALDALCYVLALRYLGWRFLVWSAVATSCTSLCYALWDQLPHLLPDLAAHPLAAALVGGCFVGIGCGLIVRQGGSSGGDDALALVISQTTGMRLSRCYLATDLSVLALSLTYIPVGKIACSLVTVTLSSLLIDRVVTAGRADGDAA